MHRRHCLNCQIAWASLPEHQLEGPHNCPRCGDELFASGQLQAPPKPAFGPGIGELAA